jgi:hypothetical protein
MRGDPQIDAPRGSEQHRGSSGMSTASLVVSIVVPIICAVLGAYISYKLGWRYYQGHRIRRQARRSGQFQAIGLQEMQAQQDIQHLVQPQNPGPVVR